MCVAWDAALDSFAGELNVQWAPDEAPTPQGQLPFFADCLKHADLFEPFLERAPLNSGCGRPRYRWSP